MPEFNSITPATMVLQRTLGQEAYTEDIRAQTKQRLMDSLLTQKKIDEDQKLAQVMALMGPQGQASNVLADQQKQDDPSSLLQRQYQEQQGQAVRYRALSDKLRAAGLGQQAELVQRDAHRLGLEANQTQMALLKQKKDDAAEIGKIASSVNDEGSFQLALPQLLARDASFGKTGPFDRNPDRQVTWGPQTAKAFTALGQMSKTAEQKTTDEIRQQNAQTAEARAQAAQQNADAATTRAAATAATVDAKTALLQAQTALAAAKTGKEVAQTTKITGGDAKKLKMVADKPPTKQAVTNAYDAISSTERFSDSDVKFPSQQAFAIDVAAVANKIVADDASKGMRTDYADALGQAIATLNPYVKEETSRGVFGIGASKTLKYVRPGGRVAGGAIREGGPATTAAPGVTEKGKPTPEEIAARYGG